MRFVLAALVNAAVVVGHPALAQDGGACVAGSEDGACMECRAEFVGLDEDDIDLLCADVTSAADPVLLPPMDCSFSSCPESLDVYQGCLQLGMQEQSLQQIPALIDRFDATRDMELEDACVALTELSTEAQRLGSIYGDLTGDNLRNFSDCAIQEIETAQGVIDAWENGDIGAEGRALTRAFDAIGLFANLRQRMEARTFVIGEELPGVQDRIMRDLSLCE